MDMIAKFTGLILFALIFELNAAQTYISNPKERIAFWRENFKTLTQQQNAHVKNAHVIFNKLIDATGNRSRINPMLYIVRDTPINIQLPIAIPDGWVIISRDTLDFAYETPSKGDDILAFILAHEIAHLMEDDFWHMKFFQAIDLSKHNNNDKQLSEIQLLAAQSDKIVAKELRADEKGLTFATMAGFNTHFILDNNDTGSFFKHWINRFSPTNTSTGAPAKQHSSTHPSPQQRELAILSRLKQIHQQSQLFNLGIWLYQAGDYKSAKDAFEEFRHYFPGRAINHNIALCYHQLALQAKPITNQLDFRTSLSLDPYTYASQIDRTAKPVDKSSGELLKKAIEFYELAISQDKQYISAYNNLASAYIENNQPYKAIGLLNDAIKNWPDNTKILNNLAISFYRIDDTDKARSFLQQSLTLDNENADTLYNLGLLSFIENKQPQAEKLWNQFLKIEPYNGWSKQIFKKLNKPHKPFTPLFSSDESINDIQVGNYLNEMPTNWEEKESYFLELNKHTYKLSYYRNGILSITEEDEINYIIADSTYQGKTNNGTRINDSLASLISKYGTPDEIQHSTTGRNIVYRNYGISFQIINNKIKSWLLFRG